MKQLKKLWIGLFVLAVLSPLGLWLPDLMKAESAWGEWSGEEIQKLVGYVPAKMAETADVWKAPIPDYALPDAQEASLQRKSFDYILSALIGIFVCCVAGFVGGRLLSRRTP